MVGAAPDSAEKPKAAQHGADSLDCPAGCFHRPDAAPAPDLPRSGAGVSTLRPWALQAVFLRWFWRVACVRSTWELAQIPILSATRAS